jgi:hypothetical protein
MAHLLSDLAHYFKLDETNIDNWTFKLFYKASSVICMTGATVGIATQYFGDPIRCPPSLPGTASHRYSHAW